MKIEVKNNWIHQNVVEFNPIEIELYKFDLLERLKSDAIDKVIEKVLQEATGNLQIYVKDYQKLTRFIWEDKPDIFGLSYDGNALGTIKTSVIENRFTVTFVPLSS